MFGKIILVGLIQEERNLNGLDPSPLCSLLLLSHCFSFNEHFYGRDFNLVM